MPFQEALDRIGIRTPIGSAMLSSEWNDVPVELRQRAFFSSQVENIRFLQRGRDLLDEFLSGEREPLPGGETALAVGGRARFVELMREFALNEGMGPLDPEDAGTIKDITSESRLSLIFNTVTQQAEDYGYYRQGMDPDVLNEFPAQRFIRVKAVKQERELHIPYEDKVYLKTDPIWAKVINHDFGVPWGPWGWGCGHDVEDVDRDEAEQLGLLKPGQKVEPNTKLFNENLRASTNGLDPDLVEKLKQDLGDQLVIKGDEMRWKSEASSPTPKVTIPPAAPAPIAPAPVQSPAAVVPVPAIPPVPAAPSQTPALPLVSDALDLDKVPKKLKPLVETALDAIDQVHDDGLLSNIPLLAKNFKKLGQFRYYTLNGKAADISVNPKGSWPALTTVHEVGHWLDLEAIGSKGSYATLQSGTQPGSGIMKGFLDAAEKTNAIKELRDQLKNASTLWERKHFKYLLKPQEIWARAYAQFIAEESADVQLSTDLASALKAEKFRQWETADFSPLKDEITKLFKSMKWV
jgi:hypothetical protein